MFGIDIDLQASISSHPRNNLYINKFIQASTYFNDKNDFILCIKIRMPRALPSD